MTLTLRRGAARRRRHPLLRRGSVGQCEPGGLQSGLPAPARRRPRGLDPPVDSPAARSTEDIGPLPGKGNGLVGAAAHSPSLTLCGPDGGGGDSFYQQARVRPRGARHSTSTLGTPGVAVIR